MIALLVLLAAPAKPLLLAPCRLENSAAEARCGTLEVPEDRAHPQGRHLKLRVAVVPSLARAPAKDPLFLLAGGPGQAATKAFGPMLPVFEKLHRSRDLVLVDQRGTGGSNALECDPGEQAGDPRPLAEQVREDEARTVEKLRACLPRLDADPRFYTTSIAMQDLDEVRAALGYDQVNLWGGSYGTRAALVYLREHGGHVRTVALDGVAPLSLALPLWFARDGQRAIDLLFDACATDAACAKAFPELKGRFAKLLAELGAKPAHALAADPITGAPVELDLSRDFFTGSLRGILYLPDLAALVPLTLDRATRGDWNPFLAQTVGLQAGFARTIALGMLFSVTCAEDVPTYGAAQIDEASRGTFLGPTVARMFSEVCSFWPRGAVPEGFHEPVRSDKPVLLLSGELDPVTPPSWAEDAAKTLPNHLSVVVPGVGHGATSEGCTSELVARLVERGTLQGLDASCVQRMKRPPFFLTFAGPAP